MSNDPTLVPQTVSTPPTEEVAVLTLTYGDRSELLEQMVAAVAAEGATRVLVLANGLAPAPADKLAQLAAAAPERYGVVMDIHTSAKNLGSAAGYARLIRAAAEIKSLAGIWLLDDDNVPRPGALALLRTQSDRLQGAAVCAVRTDRRYLIDAAAGGPVRMPRPGEAFGTDVQHQAGRVWRKLSGTPKPALPAEPPFAVAFPRVPYGGLFVPSTPLRDLTPPREDFVIYADDYEYSERLSQSVGLYLVGAAQVDDLEASWNATGKGAKTTATTSRALSQSARLAAMPPDFRLYYSVRNALWIDKQRALTSQAMGWFWINLATFALPVMGRAALKGRWENIRTLRAAICDGLAGRLGPNADHPLP